jgi:hypothetical protein
VNETGTTVSEKVHLGEIVVIQGIDELPGRLAARHLIACRAPTAPI